MTLSVNMLAPAATANMNFTARSGNSYTSDAYGVVKTVLGQDVVDLLGDNCIPLGQSTGRSNFTATTNPGVTNDTTQDYVIGSHWLNKSTGVEYVATAVTASAANWVAINGTYLGLSWLSGQFYGLPPGATQAAVLTVAGSLYAVPIFIPNSITIDSISYSVTTGQTGGKIRGALYYNSNGYPGAIVPGTDTGDLDGTGTAVVGSVDVDVDVGPGWYWLATIATATTTKPSVIGTTATYANFLNAILGSDTAAHALATSAQAATGLVKTGQTYPATDMTTSFPTFPTAAALQLNVTTPVAVIGID